LDIGEKRCVIEGRATGATYFLSYPHNADALVLRKGTAARFGVVT
jgi:hypothetical protein